MENEVISVCQIRTIFSMLRNYQGENIKTDVYSLINDLVDYGVFEDVREMRSKGIPIEEIHRQINIKHSVRKMKAAPGSDFDLGVKESKNKEFAEFLKGRGKEKASLEDIQDFKKQYKDNPGSPECAAGNEGGITPKLSDLKKGNKYRYLHEKNTIIEYDEPSKYYKNEYMFRDESGSHISINEKEFSTSIAEITKDNPVSPEYSKGDKEKDNPGHSEPMKTEYNISGNWHAPVRFLRDEIPGVVFAKLINTTSSAGDWEGYFARKVGGKYQYISFYQENNFPMSGFTLYIGELFAETDKEIGDDEAYKLFYERFFPGEYSKDNPGSPPENIDWHAHPGYQHDKEVIKVALDRLIADVLIGEKIPSKNLGEHNYILKRAPALIEMINSGKHVMINDGGECQYQNLQKEKDFEEIEVREKEARALAGKAFSEKFKKEREKGKDNPGRKEREVPEVLTKILVGRSGLKKRLKDSDLSIVLEAKQDQEGEAGGYKYKVLKEDIKWQLTKL